MTPDLALKSILIKTVNIPEEFESCYQLFSLAKEDIEFVKSQILLSPTDQESHLDALIRLFIAFFAESLPQQITFNLANMPKSAHQNPNYREYLLAIAGLLHEAKVMLNDNSELFMPYVLAYDEFTRTTSQNALQLPEQMLLKNFVNNVESAIQAVIKI